MSDNPSIYILGGAQTDFARNWSRQGLGIFDMFAEVLRAGIAHAGVEPSQVEVGHVGNFVGELFTGQGLLGGFFGEVFPEMGTIPTSRHEAACASGSIAILAAMREIEAGHYDMACVLGLELMRNVDGKTGADHLGAAVWRGREALDCNYPWPFMFDRVIEEYDQRYGINCDYLKQIGRINFENASRNLNAQTRNWAFHEASFSDDDDLNPVIEGRVRKLDCGQVTDGAACIVLASKKAATAHAEKHGIKLADIPCIKGWGHRSSAIGLEDKLAGSKNKPLIFPHAALTVKEALNRAGLSAVTDLDALETHDCFTITEYMAIDHIGLTAPGESWKAVAEGRIARDGDFPINPSGGLIGLGHPVGATGVRMVLDSYKQLTGQAGAYQLPKIRNMLTLNLGGSATTCASFVVGVN